MTMPVLVHLSEDTYQHFKLLAHILKRDVAEVIAEQLEQNVSGAMNIEKLSDAEVLLLADSKMDKVEDARMHQLINQSKERPLNDTENTELESLMDIYDTGNLLKAQGALEAVRRGLRSQ